MSRQPSPEPQPQELPGGSWVPVDDRGEHPLASLAQRPVLGTRPRVLLGPANRVGAQYFQVHLENSHGGSTLEPAVAGLHHSGPYPAHNWIEIFRMASRIEFSDGDPRTVDLDYHRGYPELIDCLACAIPPGGHLMLEYESPEHRETERLLDLGVPPPLTPLGFLLFRAGCGHGFKNWYISEGWTEGPRKLQGYRAMDDGHARSKEEELAAEVLAFLQRDAAAAMEVRERAEVLVARLVRCAEDTIQQLHAALAHLRSNPQ